MNSRIKQILQDSYSAQYIYTKKSKMINVILIIINLLAIVVPLVVLFALYIFKGTDFQKEFDVVASFISFILLVLSIIALIFKFDEKRQDYIIGKRENKAIEEKARSLLNEYDDSKLTFFFSHVTDVDNHDSERIGSISLELKREAYRESLKKIDLDGNAVCPTCNASPFKYNKGDCQTCGNTPNSE